MELTSIKEDHLIEKRNILNEMRSNNMTLQELRFFSIYLSKINAREPSTTRLVRFKLWDFQRIMDLSRLQTKDIKGTVDGLLCKIVHIPTETGGFTAFQLFKKCRVDQDSEARWYVEIDAHDDALPLMFEFKDRYFTYQLWNALRLKSANQVRMYELLKQYERIGERIISLDDLRSMLGIESHEYPRWVRFRDRVLDSCQSALSEATDIKFNYEPIRKGVGRDSRKITHVKFLIKKNTAYVDQLTLDEFIDLQPSPGDIEESEKETAYDEHLKFIAEACDFEFSNTQVQVIFNHLISIKNLFERYHLVKSQHDRLKMHADKDNISNRFAYFDKMIASEIARLR